ncbi:MAG: hypothetical protein K2K58_06525 [Muribaculaceae bacterium]|nr:hypothetical protein [Muribaculaceae bacterium]
MAAGFVIDWNAWRVWRHPRMACHALDKLTVDLMTTEEKLREALDLLEEQRRECVRLTTSLTELSERLIAKDNELVTVRRELDMARADLAEQETVDRKLAAFSAKLSEVELMKKNYEKTITTLRARLKDARHRLGQKDNYDLFETIVMDAPAEGSRPEAQGTRLKAQGTRHDAEKDPQENLEPRASSLEPNKDEWIFDSELPDEEKIAEERRTKLRRQIEGMMSEGKPPKPGELRVNPGKTPDDDWLIPLPEL